MQPAPGSEQATCSYCGTVSFIQRPRAAPAPVVVRSSTNLLVFVALGCGVFVMAGVGLCVFLLTGRADESVTVVPASPRATSAAPISAATVAPSATAKVPPIKVLSNFPPLLADVDGDGSDDIVVALASKESAGTTEHYAAFSGRTGRELSRTAALPERNNALPIVDGRRLITASDSGQLTSYGLGNGSQQWTTALGARATPFCATKSSDSLLILTDEDRRLAVDSTTGRQSESKEPCTSALARSERGDDPHDRHDYSAPRGTESYYCGGVTVMGSANYSVADQCLARAHIDTDHLDGMVGHRLWKSDQNWLVFGVRKPGSAVPMVGLIARGRLAWKAEVPLDNPLEAQEGGPQYVALSGNQLIVAYSTTKDRRVFVTAFAVEGGTRRWTSPLPAPITGISSLKSSADRVFVQTGDELLWLNAADGKAITSIGEREH